MSEEKAKNITSTAREILVLMEVNGIEESDQLAIMPVIIVLVWEKLNINPDKKSIESFIKILKGSLLSLNGLRK